MNEKHCRSINDMSEKRCRNRNITNGKSSRNRNEMEGKSCSHIRKSCGKLWSLQGSWKQIVIKVRTSAKKVRRQAGKSLCKCAKKFVQAMALRKRNFVQCVEKVCAKVQKMNKLAKQKIVQVCREIRAMFV